MGTLRNSRGHSDFWSSSETVLVQCASSRLSSSSQNRQNKGLAAAHANSEVRFGESTTLDKQGANAAETTSNVAISAFFIYSCIVFKSPFAFRPTFHRSGILEILENLLEMPERRNEPFLILSMDRNEGYPNPESEQGKACQRIRFNASLDK
jgi:hypothetical protein